MINIEYKIQKSNVEDIYNHLIDIDTDIIPKLSSSVNLQEFSKKIFNNTIRFEAWHFDKLIGLISVYYNNINERIGFINHVGVSEQYRGLSISSILLDNSIEYGRDKDFQTLKLDVAVEANIAKELYIKNGFEIEKINKTTVKMYKKLDNGDIK